MHGKAKVINGVPAQLLAMKTKHQTHGCIYCSGNQDGVVTREDTFECISTMWPDALAFANIDDTAYQRVQTPQNTGHSILGILVVGLYRCKLKRLYGLGHQPIWLGVWGNVDSAICKYGYADRLQKSSAVSESETWLL